MSQNSPLGAGAGSSATAPAGIRRSTSGGNVTATATETTDQRVQPSPEVQTYVLKLRSAQKKKSIGWSKDTVDNEHLGRKSSKRCCIFHKRRAFAESDSDESDSDVEEAAKPERQQDQTPGHPSNGTERRAAKPRPKNYQRHHA